MYEKLLITTFLLTCLTFGAFLLLLSLNNKSQGKNWQEIFGNALVGLGAVACFITLLFADKAVHSFASLSLIGLAGILAAMSVGASVFFRANNLASILSPIAIIVLFVEQFFLAAKNTNISEFSRLKETLPFKAIGYIHIGFATLGQAFAVFACATAISYLWQRQLLKKKRLQDLNINAPGLDRLDRLLTMALWLGFSFLTLSLLTGPIVVALSSSSFESIKLKIFWAIAVWLWYLSTLGLKVVFHFRPTQIAKMSLVGFAFVAFLFLGIYVLFPLRALN